MRNESVGQQVRHYISSKYPVHWERPRTFNKETSAQGRYNHRFLHQQVGASTIVHKMKENTPIALVVTTTRHQKHPDHPETPVS